MLQSAVTRWHFLLGFLGLGAVAAAFGLFIYSLVNDGDYQRVLPPVPDRAKQVMTYWFGTDDGKVSLDVKRLQLWDLPTETQKEQMAQQFSQDIQKSIEGINGHWGMHPRGRLSLIVLLDPISEHLQDPLSAIKQNQLALELATDGIRKNQDVDLSLVERAFFYRPLMDAESLAVQNRAVALYERLYEIAPSGQKAFFNMWLTKAKQRRDIVYKFGRFPERNKVLDRDSTELEKRFLENRELSIQP